MPSTWTSSKLLEVRRVDADRVDGEPDRGRPAERRGQQPTAPASSHRPVARITYRGSGTQSGISGSIASAATRWTIPIPA